LNINKETLLGDIEKVVTPGGVLVDEEVLARSDNWPPTGGCKAKAIIRPASSAEVSAVVRICHAAGQSIVTHGGLTGLVGGATACSDDIVISLERMSNIESVDSLNRTLIVEAGAPLQKVQEAVESEGLLFPLDLGARGSCTIGGNIATNAGGNSVIRYGMMREQLLGLEAVLADGTIISSLKGVIKNNTGYDLKQLFVGSEGTLGIVTRAVLRLRPLPRSCNTALIAIDDFANLGAFLNSMDSALGGTLSAFEVMWNDFYTLITKDSHRHQQPLSASHAYYVLLEATGGHPESDRILFESALEEAFESNLIVDAVIAQSEQQGQDLWAIRDDIEGLTSRLPQTLLFDISLGIPDMQTYVDEIRQNLLDRWPASKLVVFGHLGDGNIHLALTVGSQDPVDVDIVDSIIYEALGKRNGIISAEHGIGLDKREYLKHSRSNEELMLMKTLKKAMDPKNILNPGKIFA
jgi:FAD/FMN-containing dehydrogenase